jgi:hypothetical protein
MSGAFQVAALTVALAQGPFPPSADDAGNRPKLVVKEKDYFLHALPLTETEPPPRLGARVRTTLSGLTLLHTSTATGEMKVLAASTTTLIDLQRNSGDAVSQTRIVGVAVDKERLFVLQFSFSTLATEGNGEKYHLLVFRPADGVLVHSLELKGDGLPAKRPAETADKGPLRLHPDGVACFGTRFEFKGTELIKRSAEKKS